MHRVTAALFCLGADYRRVRVDQRSNLRPSADDIGAWWRATRETSSIDELLAVATCHRTEIYLVARDPAAAGRAVRRLGRSWCGADVFDPEVSGIAFEGLAAAERMCRLAAGLESMVLGEPQVSGQVRAAAVEARRAGTLGPSLERVVAGALRASARVRQDTSLGRGASSLAGAALTLAEREVGPLSRRRILVIGRGPMGRECADRLTRRRPVSLCVASRSPGAEAGEGGEAAGVLGLDEVPGALRSVDVAIAAVRSSGWRIDARTVAAAARDRERPLVLIDLSVPCVIDPEVGRLSAEAVRHFTVDDLGDVAAAARARRRAAVPAAARIAADEAARAHAALRRRLDARHGAVAGRAAS